MAAPTLNGEVAHGTLALVTSVNSTITLTADVVGNLLVLGIGMPSLGQIGITLTDSRGNSWARAGANNLNGIRGEVHVGRMDHPLRSGDTITATVSTGGVTAAYSVLDYSNANITTTTIDKFGSGGGTSNAASSGGSGVTTVADEIIVGFTALLAASGYSAAGAGYVQRGTIVSTGTAQIAFEDKTQSATSSQTTTATLTGSPAWVQCVACIRGSTRWYVDYSKADDTGAGTSWATAKKNLSAITPLSGDTITLAKATDPASQTGTMTFTDNSTSVATSADLTGALAAKDMIGPYTSSELVEGDGWWEISSLTASTITLAAAYSGTTRTTVTGYRYNGFDAGSPALSTTSTLGTANVLGTAASPITVIGGYNTGNDTRDGVTHMRVSSATKNGAITWGSNFHYFSYIAGSRHAKTMTMGSNNVATLSHFFVASGGAATLDGSGTGASGKSVSVDHGLITGCGTSTNLSGSSGRYTSVRLENSGQLTGAGWAWFDTCTVRRNGNSGSAISFNSDFCTAVNCTVTFSNQYGIGGNSGIATGWISGCTLANNTTADIRSTSSVNPNAHMYVANCATSSATLVSNASGAFVHFDRFNQTAKSWRTYHERGNFFSNTANARTNTCVEMQPSASSVSVAETEITDGKLHMDFLQPIPVKGSGTLTVTVWVKANSSWNGKIRRFGLKYMGQWVSGSPSAVSLVPGGAYRQYTFTYTMVSTDTVEFVAHIDGTAGSVYVSDLAWSMA